jgi:hypothetical protein
MSDQINLIGNAVKKIKKSKSDKWVDILMWAISGPIIVSPGGWGITLLKR